MKIVKKAYIRYLFLSFAFFKKKKAPAIAKAIKIIEMPAPILFKATPIKKKNEVVKNI